MPLRITSGECSGGEMPAYTVARVRRKAHQVHATSILLLRGDELLDLGLVGQAVQYSLLGLLAQRLADSCLLPFPVGGFMSSLPVIFRSSARTWRYCPLDRDTRSVDFERR